MPSSEYSEEDIRKIDPREHVRMRPGMYIGGTDVGALHHLIYQLMDHMIEEAFVGRCRNIWLTLQPDHQVMIRDDSLGLSVAPYRDTKLTQLEALMSETYTMKSEFEPQIYDAKGLDKAALGLRMVNALCAAMTVDNQRDGFLWRQTYSEGLAKTPLIKVQPLADESTGTTFTFTPDFTIFEENEFDRERLRNRCQELAYLMPELTITLRDERTQPAYEACFQAAEGLKTLIADLNADSTPLHDIVHIRENVVIPQDGRDDFTVGIEIAIQFTEGEATNIFSFANTIPTPDGGTHVAALRAALLSSLNEHIDLRNHKNLPFTWPEIAPGLSAAIAIRHLDPQFEGATKVRLFNLEIYGPVAGLVYPAFYRSYRKTDPVVKHLLAKRSAPRP